MFFRMTYLQSCVVWFTSDTKARQTEAFLETCIPKQERTQEPWTSCAALQQKRNSEVPHQLRTIKANTLKGASYQTFFSRSSLIAMQDLAGAEIDERI